MAINRFSPLAQFEAYLREFTGALSSIVESFHEPQKSFKQILLQPVPPPVQSQREVVRRFWKNDEAIFASGRPDRSTVVQQKLDELRRFSSPTQPLCFRCGDKGHIASQCRNAVLCFACNQFGHRSMRCRSFQTPTPTPQPLITSISTPPTPLTSNPSLPGIGIGSGQYSAPGCHEVAGTDSIERMAMELAALKQDLKLLQAREAEMEISMADIKSQFHLTQANLAAYEADRAIQRCAISEEQRRNAETVTGFSSLHIGTNPLSSAQQNQ